MANSIGYEVILSRKGTGWRFDDTIYATKEEARAKMVEALCLHEYTPKGLDTLDDAAVYEVTDDDDDDPTGTCVHRGRWVYDFHDDDDERSDRLIVDGVDEFKRAAQSQQAHDRR